MSMPRGYIKSCYLISHANYTHYTKYATSYCLRRASPVCCLHGHMSFDWNISKDVRVLSTSEQESIGLCELEAPVRHLHTKVSRNTSFQEYSLPYPV